MAFNLNKGEENKSKFDLSKSSGSTVNTNDAIKKKSSMWIFALLGIAIIAAGIWYFFGRSTSSETTAQTSSDSTQKVKSNGDTSKIANANVPDSMNSTAPQSTTANLQTNTPEKATDNSSKIASTPTTSKANSNNSVASNNNSSNPIAPNNNTSSIPASFRSGSSTLNSVDTKIVTDIKTYLSKNPNAKITVNGYASSEGAITVNQNLSKMRANAFKTYLIRKGISSDKINAIGNGIDNPIASNDTEEGRVKNRRVEVNFQ